MRSGLADSVSPFYAVLDPHQQGFPVWSFLDFGLSIPGMDAGEVHEDTVDFAYARRPALFLAVPLVCLMGSGAVRRDRVDLRSGSLA